MLRSRQRFGKYVIQKRLAEGGFATVYQALDTIEGVRVALKIPHAHLLTSQAVELFRHEVRITAQLEHPHILPLKYADYIEGQFVIVTALGESTLEDRLQKRLSSTVALAFATQMLSAVAYAHEHRIIHCDIKPDNFVLFPEQRLRLTDFGIARVALKTLRGSGAGTVGYIAPEQAMGKPSFRSDVFSLGLIVYRMLSGALPEWPYHWPPAGYNRLRARAHPDLIALIRKSIELEARRRFRDAGQMEAAFLRIRSPLRKRPVEKSATRKTRPETTKPDWQVLRRREFQRHYGKWLQTHASCPACGGPISEAMHGCPWCGKKFPQFPAETSFPTRCPRCRRGLKLDWLYCPWCYGPGFEPESRRQYADRRYAARCSNTRCSRRQLMPFMQYCPWCHRRVRRKWRIEGSKDTCSRCGWGVLRLYWSYCPWCARRLES